MEKIILGVNLCNSEIEKIKKDLENLQVQNCKAGDIIYLESGYSHDLGFNLLLLSNINNRAIFKPIY